MKPKKGLLTFAWPACALVALLGGAIYFRSGTEMSAPPPAPRKAGVSVSKEWSQPLSPTPRPPTLPQLSTRPSSASALAAADDDARIRANYQNYRTAVVTGNTPAQEGLEKLLRRDREAVRKLAQEAMASSRDEYDRMAAVQTLEILGR